VPLQEEPYGQLHHGRCAAVLAIAENSMECRCWMVLSHAFVACSDGPCGKRLDQEFIAVPQGHTPILFLKHRRLVVGAVG
jgi:hypothetical protein